MRYLLNALGAVWLALVLSLALWPAQSAWADGLSSKSHTGVDSLVITKITPRTGADIPAPAELPFTMEVSYRLKSAPVAKVRVGVFLWKPGLGAGRVGAKKGLVPLCKITEKTLRNSQGKTVLVTPPVKLAQASQSNTQVVVIVNMQNGNKKELCWASSYNFLRGSLVVRPASKGAGRDTITVMSCLPKVGNLTAGKNYTFVVNFQYSLKSKKYGFVNFEWGDNARRGNLGPWYNVCVPVKSGTGVVKMVSGNYLFPSSWAEKKMNMEVFYRVAPLGGTITMNSYGPWTIKRAALR